MWKTSHGNSYNSLAKCINASPDKNNPRVLLRIKTHGIHYCITLISHSKKKKSLRSQKTAFCILSQETDRFVSNCKQKKPVASQSESKSNVWMENIESG